MVKKYFVDFEFESEAGNIYWLPIFINESDTNRAYKIAVNIRTAISEKFKILRNPEPSQVIQGCNSELYDEYVKNNFKGRLSILNINFWELKNIEPKVGFSFDQHLQLVDYHPEKFANKTIAEGENIKLPVKMVTKGISDYSEFLVIDVVRPK